MLIEANHLESLSRELIIIMDVEGNIREISPNFKLLLGHCSDCQLGKNIKSMTIKSDVDFKGEKSIEFVIKNKEEKAQYFDGVLNKVKNNNEELWVISALNITDYVSKREGSENEIVKELKLQLEKLSHFDALTGLYNRNYIEYEMEKLDLLEDVPLGMIVCDLDNLKITNDTYGHCEGDYLLQQAADIIRVPLGENMLPGRIGGDEFIVLLKNAPREKVKEVYGKIVLAVKQYNKLLPSRPVEISIGYSHMNSSKGATKELFKRADERMYADKKERHRLQKKKSQLQNDLSRYKALIK